MFRLDHNRLPKFAIVLVAVLAVVAGLLTFALVSGQPAADPNQSPVSPPVAAAATAPEQDQVGGHQIQITVGGQLLGGTATIVLRGYRGEAMGTKRVVRVDRTATVKRLNPGNYRISAMPTTRNGRTAEAIRIAPDNLRVTERRGASVAITYQARNQLETPRTMAVINRVAWGALAARSGMDRHTPVRLTLHHSGVQSGNFDGPSRIRAHQRFHMEQHKDSEDIMYHYAVDRLGNIYEARNPKYRGGTMTTYETGGHFLIDLDGDFQQNQEPTQAQLRAGADLFAYAAGRWQIDPATLAGHRDYAQTTCPGDALYRHLKSGRLERMIQQRLDSGGIQLKLMPTWQGRNLVDRIESGQAEPVR